MRDRIITRIVMITTTVTAIRITKTTTITMMDMVGDRQDLMT